MNTITTSVLTDAQKSDISSLLKTCRNHDKINAYISLDSSINYIPDLPCFFLTYEDKILCSILSIFTPNNYDCEIYAYTLPEYRQNHIFSDRLYEVLKLIEKSTIQNIYLVAEPHSISALKTADSISARLDYSEYMLSYNIDRRFSPKHILKLNTIKDNNTETVHLTHNNSIISICRLYINDNYASIFDFEVLEEHRNKGFGKESLLTIIEYLIKQNISSITLNVSSTNKKAHKLYTTYGFSIEEQIDYYRLPITY